MVRCASLVASGGLFAKYFRALAFTLGGTCSSLPAAFATAPIVRNGGSCNEQWGLLQRLPWGAARPTYNRMSKSCYFYLAVVTLGARRASFSEAIPFPFIT
ncbi:hypothetical protein EXIGLDRAFT_80212 [Exidia glandulosa HHB12029]|uniref:Uncharacterized protein n=1 Tax=Exidia glandulosa HHB12029 TaxID=1314781 RepID=A0A165HNK2_EXIGL|nr:hypothetical protein EXIGLDRAFT_80212 [Exidia glandulosa HHB12029]